MEQFRTLANNHLLREMETEKRDILDILNGEGQGGLFVNSPVPENQQRAIRGMKQICHSLKTTHRLWEPVLNAKVLHEAMFQMMEFIAEKLLLICFSYTDISVEEAVSLPNILLQFTQPMLNWLLSWQLDTGFHLAKLGHWIAMMDMKMVTMVGSYLEGEFPQFEQHEMVQIVRALFTDSPLRNTQIKLLNTSK